MNSPLWLLRALLLRQLEYHSGFWSARERCISCENLIRRSVRLSVSHRGNERTSRTTMAREYISDFFVTLIMSCSGTPSNMSNRSGAIHLMDPALFTGEACGDFASAVVDANPKSHRTAFLSLLMRMFGYTYRMSDAVKHILRSSLTPFMSPCTTCCEWR